MKLLNYIERKSPVHSLNGASKLFCLLMWICSTMITFNTPFLIGATVLGAVAFKLSRLKLSEQKGLLYFLLCFMLLNAILIYVFNPERGVELYGTRNLIAEIWGRFTITKEQLLYQFNVILKYLSTIPIILVFIGSTQPSELAASMNRIGIPYSFSYSFALALRYIPDTVASFIDISRCQQARGIEMSNKESLGKRIKAAALLVLPLILGSVEQIEVITNAMELRKFGTQKRRTWIMSRPFRAGDYLTIAIGLGMMAFVIAYNVINGSRFWNPFT